MFNSYTCFVNINRDDQGKTMASSARPRCGHCSVEQTPPNPGHTNTQANQYLVTLYSIVATIIWHCAVVFNPESIDKSGPWRAVKSLFSNGFFYCCWEKEHKTQANKSKSMERTEWTFNSISIKIVISTFIAATRRTNGIHCQWSLLAQGSELDYLVLKNVTVRRHSNADRHATNQTLSFSQVAIFKPSERVGSG